MDRRYFSAVAPLVLLLPFSAHSGGWATITLEDLPDYVVANQPTDLVFTVRQHGQEALTGLKPMIEARSGKRHTSVPATPTKVSGQYAVSLQLPEPGEWDVTIHSRFGPSSVTLLPLRAVGAGALAPPSYAPAERGQRLFVAKGCVTCHVHRDVKDSGRVKAGPDLSEPRLTSDYLARFLADPTIRPPTGPNRMPDFGLEPAEISALVAFLSTERKLTKSR